MSSISAQVLEWHTANCNMHAHLCFLLLLLIIMVLILVSCKQHLHSRLWIAHRNVIAIKAMYYSKLMKWIRSHQCFITNAALTRHILSYGVVKNNEVGILRMRRLSDHRTPAADSWCCCLDLNDWTPSGLHDKAAAKKDIQRQRKTVWRVTRLGVLDALDITAW